MRTILFIILSGFGSSLSTFAQLAATITATGPTTFCLGDSVYLVANANADTYQWLLNGSPITGANNDTLVVNAAGSYEVTIDSAGNIDTSLPEVVTVNTLPAQPGPISGPDPLCTADTGTYTILPVPGATSYLWDNFGTTLSSTTTTLQLTGMVALLNLKVRAVNACGSSLPSPAKSVYTLQSPTNTGLWYILNPDPLCPGDVYYIWINVVHTGDQFAFYKDGALVQSGSSAGYEVTSSGTYYCIVTNQAGCSVQTNPHLVVFEQEPPQPVIIQVGSTLTTTQSYSFWAWALNGNFMGTGQYYYPTQDGDYTVTVGNSVPCYSQSAPYTVSYTSVNSVTKDGDFSISPNPVMGRFKLKGDVSTVSNIASITITDITGRILRSEDIPVKNATVERDIDIDIPPGLYFLKLSTEGFTKTASFISQ